MEKAWATDLANEYGDERAQQEREIQVDNQRRQREVEAGSQARTLGRAGMKEEAFITWSGSASGYRN